MAKKKSKKREWPVRTRSRHLRLAAFYDAHGGDDICDTHDTPTKSCRACRVQEQLLQQPRLTPFQLTLLGLAPCRGWLVALATCKTAAEAIKKISRMDQSAKGQAATFFNDNCDAFVDVKGEGTYFCFDDIADLVKRRRLVINEVTLKAGI